MQIDISTERKAGVYKITCKNNGKRYIGSSKSIYYRLHRHKSDLKSNTHDNKNLQNSFNKYGEESFIIEIMEYCEEDERFEREQHWINKLKPEFNVVQNVIDCEITEEMKVKISDTLKAKYKSGEIKRTAITKVWQFNLDGTTYKIWDAVTDAAKQFEGNISNMEKKIHEACKQDRIQSYKGFVWSKVGEFKAPKRKNMTAVLVRDIRDNSAIEIESRVAFARYFNCSVSTFDYFLKKKTLYQGVYEISRLSINPSNSVDDLKAETIPSQASKDEGVTTS